jgi:fructoselysine 6-phosphate deglycase
MSKFKMPTIEEIRNHPNPNYLEGNEVGRTLSDILAREDEHVARLVEEWIRKGVDKLFLVGSGGSRSIMEPGKYIMDRYADFYVERYSASEFATRKPKGLGPKSVVVIASHSGETEGIIEAVKLAKKFGAITLGFTGKHKNTLVGLVDDYLYYDSPAANLSKLLMVYLVCAHLLTKIGAAKQGQELLTELKKLPEKVLKIKEAYRENGFELAKKHKEKTGYYLVGSGPLYGLAYQFAICTLMEMQWIHTAAIHAAEFQHGPFEVVEPGVTFIFLLGLDESRSVTEKALRFAQTYGADTIVFDAAGVKDIHPMLTPFALAVMLQWFAYALSVERQHPLAVRRYMGKVAY